MGDGSSIEWTEATWNPTSGCTKVSQGCKHCYAERMAVRLHGRAGYPEGKPFTPTLHPERLGLPLRWRKPRRIFVDSMSDLFHEAFDAKYIAKVFAIMDIARQHTYQVLTKRPERAAELLNDEDFQFHVGWFQSQAEREFGLPRMDPKNIGPWPLRNVWLGASTEDHATACARIPHLLACPAAVRFLSCEPLLGPISLRTGIYAMASDGTLGGTSLDGIHWVITGGESGPGARPCDEAWLRDLRDQCAAAGVPFFLKQLGGHPDKRGHDDALLDGRLCREMPREVRP